MMPDRVRTTGRKTKREAEEAGRRLSLRLQKQAEIRRFRGKLDWQGELSAMRSDR